MNFGLKVRRLKKADSRESTGIEFIGEIMTQYQRRRIQEDIDRQMAANAPQRAIPWGSIINFLVILAVIIAVGAMDRLHADEIAALENIITTQAEIISMTECPGDIEMSVPIGRVEL